MYFYTHGYVGHMPYPMSVTHRKCKFNFNKLVLLIYLFENETVLLFFLGKSP